MGDLEPRPEDRSLLRVSDADRHQVADILREAAGDGRIDFEELEQRLEATYAAKTYADLVPITSDLPSSLPGADSTARSREVVRASSYPQTIAIMGGATRAGVWEVPARHTVFTMWGGVDIDLREARFTADETVIIANAIWGGVDIVVNESTRVIVEGIGIMGAFDQSRDKVAANLTDDSPVVRVKGIALMAGVSVIRKPMPGEEKKLGWRRR